MYCLFFFYYPATPEIYTYVHPLSLHDALPISAGTILRSHVEGQNTTSCPCTPPRSSSRTNPCTACTMGTCDGSSWELILTPNRRAVAAQRSEEHTSELQSLMSISYAVFCLKTKKKHNLMYTHHHDTHYS